MANLKLTPELQEEICKKLSIGCTRESAAVSSGIHKKTYYNWLALGEKQKSGRYYDFFHAVKKAEAEAVVAGEAALRKLIHEGNVAAVIFFLVNRTKNYPLSERWENTHNVRQSLTGADGEPLKITINVGTRAEQENVRLLTEGERTE